MSIVLGPNPSFPDFKAHLQSVSTTLFGLESLHPCPPTNAAFTALIVLLTKAFENADQLASQALADPTLTALGPQLRSLASAGESLLESHWAAIILAPTETPSTLPWFPSFSPPPPPSLAPFPYLSNYVALVGLEHSLLLAVGAKTQNIHFLGSGPLPLSPLLLLRDFLPPSTDRVLTCVDNDAKALNLGKDLVCAVVRGTTVGEEVRVPGKGIMRFVCADAAKVGGKGGKPDVVFLAALVGVGEEKMQVALSVIKGLKEGAVLLMRSAAGLRKLVYEEVLDGDVVRRAREAGTPVRVVLVVHPKDEVVNSVVVFIREKGPNEQ